MKKKNFMNLILIIFVLISGIRIIELGLLKHDYYTLLYEESINKYITLDEAPRGRILDTNGKVLVDNRGINSITYNNLLNNTNTNEIQIAYKLGEILKFDLNKITENKLKNFYLANNHDGKELITEEEYSLYKKRKLTKEDLNALKYERITDEMLKNMRDEEKNASAIYSILTSGYYYEDKIIKRDITDEEVVQIKDLNIPGIEVKMSWERIYPYGEVLKTIFGSISTNGVPKEYAELYKSREIKLNSTVGISFLEFQYDEYLRGQDAVYKLDSKGNIELVTEETKGLDIYLSIDIEKQLEIENILKKEMLNAKKAKNSDFYNHSYIIVGHPKTGEIIAATGLLLNKDHFIDITANIINSSYTVGSIVKGATMSVGYQQNLIEEGKKVKDACVKVYGVQEKCSWTSLGMIDDISAMAESSNYYQFMIATRLTNPNYKWNSKLNATKEHFDIYRNMLKSYGLGELTGIDLPNEQTGIIGKTISDDLLLNLAIGQYDTYTPIEVFQYINTLANDGVRVKPSLLKKIVKSNGEEIKREVEILNQVDLSPEKMSRVQKGLKEVMISGLGKNYSSVNITSAGKTGTSETFVDTNGDGKVDTKTISTSFIMYAPAENPEYSIVILSPNIAKKDGDKSYKYSLNLRVNREIVKYLFEK